MSAYSEKALVFDCQGESLVGVLSVPDLPARHAVLIVVGGPQYRAGSHRQFTLLARHLAVNGIASLRFDYRGMGDSTGGARSFERTGEDIACAIERLLSAVPTVREVVIWGLCDAASAALFYAHQDSRVRGLVLLNPWVRTEQGLARAQLRHYYVARLLQPSFWRKLVHGEFSPRAAGASLGKAVRDAAAPTKAPLPERMEEGLRRFKGKVLFILSGNDLTAQEFKTLVAGSAGWRRLLEDARVERYELIKANHTFSTRAWRDEVADRTTAWVKAL